MTKHHLRLAIFLLSSLATNGVSALDNLTIKSSDPEHLDLLMTLLDNRNIPYEYSEGRISYRDDVKDEVEKAEKSLATAASVQYIDTDLREHFHSILYMEDIEFLALDRDGGSWTLWWAGSKDREMEILNQVTEYKITRQLEEDADCETGPGRDPLKHLLIQDALRRSETR
ncbi:hypothetical protein [Kaarinaea lacus]